MREVIVSGVERAKSEIQLIYNLSEHFFEYRLPPLSKGREFL